MIPNSAQWNSKARRTFEDLLEDPLGRGVKAELVARAAARTYDTKVSIYVLL